MLLKANFYSSPSRTLDADVSLFSNLVYCKNCKSRLTFNSNRKKTFIYRFYRCSAYIQRGKENCKPHRITLAVLSYAVLEDVKIKARLAKADEEAFIKELYQASLQDKKQRITEVTAQETEAKNRLNDIDHMIQSVFEKNVKGEISDKIFNGLIAKYETEKLALEEEAETLKYELMESRSEAKDIQKDLEELKKYAEITELNRKIVTSLIHSIHISEPKQVDGMKTYDIEIKYNFQKV